MTIKRKLKLIGVVIYLQFFNSYMLLSSETDTIQKQLDVYSNYEKIDLSNILDIQSACKYDSTAADFLHFNHLELSQSFAPDLFVYGQNGTLIYSCKLLQIEEESIIETTYLGFDSSINYHLICIKDQYMGGQSYILLSHDGMDTIQMLSYPCMNAKKEIVSLQANIYDDMTYFTLYRYKNGRFQEVVTCSFDQWMADIRTNKLMWTEDNSLIIPYKRSSDFTLEDESPATEYLCLKSK